MPPNPRTHSACLFLSIMDGSTQDVAGFRSRSGEIIRLSASQTAVCSEPSHERALPGGRGGPGNLTGGFLRLEETDKGGSGAKEQDARRAPCSSWESLTCQVDSIQRL